MPSLGTGRRSLVSRLLWLSATSAPSPRSWNAAHSLSASASAASGTAAMAPPVADPSRLWPYEPPSWCRGRFSRDVPSHRLSLANLPTPLYRLSFPDDGHPAATTHLLRTDFLSRYGISLWIKRDDATGGIEVGGNKLRKLEFLLADALLGNCRRVVTIGGLQSNHCRATASASRMVGLEPHLILRTSSAPSAATDPSQRGDPGFVGNLLVDRFVGSTLYSCSPGEYGRLGSEQLVARVCRHLLQQQEVSQRQTDGGGNDTADQPHQPPPLPYAIPVGGSNGIGSWGYLEAVDELLTQLGGDVRSFPDRIVVAAGSGGTVAGIVVGLALACAWQSHPGDSTAPPHVHAVGVCDDPDYFYGQVTRIAREMGVVVLPENGQPLDLESFVRRHLTVHQGKGLGYAASTPDELAFVAEWARQTGVVLDPVYTGKAWYHFWNLLERDPQSFANQTILFWHTGGALGLYDKVSEASLQADLLRSSPCHRLDVYGKGIGIDISQTVDMEER